MKNRSKWIKRIIFWTLIAAGITILALGIALTCDANLGEWTQTKPNDNSISSGKIAGISFLIGFCLGVTTLAWYPASRILAWAKTRTLKNKNLEMDLKLKEQQLNQNENKE